MKVLLYEPRDSGHRGTVLRYVQRCLVSLGHSYVTLVKPMTGGSALIPQLSTEAIRHQCDIIHVLTLDDHLRHVLCFHDMSLSDRTRVPVVATYYLFSRLYEGARSLCLEIGLRLSGVGMVLISDDYCRGRLSTSIAQVAVGFIPDPWDANEFPIIDKYTASEKLGLRTDVVRFLVFGDLSQRKGLAEVIDAFDTEKLPNTELVLAGTLSDDIRQGPVRARIAKLEKSGRVILRDGFVPEAEISSYFCAADAIICAYPAWFSVSSGTFTRACAASRPVLANNHGVVGRMVNDLALGWTFASGTSEDIRAGVRKIAENPAGTFFNSANAAAVAKSRVLPEYAFHLGKAYMAARSWSGLNPI